MIERRRAQDGVLQMMRPTKLGLKLASGGQDQGPLVAFAETLLHAATLTRAAAWTRSALEVRSTPVRGHASRHVDQPNSPPPTTKR